MARLTGAVFAVLLVVFSFCPAHDLAAGGGQAAGKAASEENLVKLSGGELRFGLTSEPATLDPLSSANTADGRSILFNVYEGLVMPDPDGNLIPAVAESWTVEQGGAAYHFILRQGLKFSDGSPLTSSDVEFSLNLAKEAKYQGYDQITNIEIKSPTELVINFKAPDPEILAFLTLGIVPKKNDDREKKPIGSGPFVIESYNPQQSLVLVKNPNYRKPGVPILDKVTIVFVADSDSLVLALQGGNIDAGSVTGAVLSQLQNANFDIVENRSNTVQLLALNNAVAPLDKLEVRQAINYAIDVQEIIDTAFYGHGEPSGSPLIPGLTASYNSSLKNPYPVDINKAKALLAQAGLANGFNLEITVPSNYKMHVDTAQVIVNQLAKIGVKANIRLVDWASWLSDTYRGRKFEATIISLDAANVSPRTFLSRYRSTGGSNFINFKNADYDAVYKQCLTEMDDAKRHAEYKQMQQIISDNAASVYIQDILNFRAFKGKSFGGSVDYPLYVIDFSTMYRTGPAQ